MHPANPQPRFDGALTALAALLLLAAGVPARAGGYGADAHVTYAEVVQATPRYGWTEVFEPVRHCEAVGAAGRGGGYHRDYRSRRYGYREHGYHDPHPVYDRHRVVRRCSEAVQSRRVRGVQGYDVTYRYQGRAFHKFINEHPGDSVRIHVEVEPLDGVAAR